MELYGQHAHSLHVHQLLVPSMGNTSPKVSGEANASGLSLTDGRLLSQQILCAVRSILRSEHDFSVITQSESNL